MFPRHETISLSRSLSLHTRCPPPLFLLLLLLLPELGLLLGLLLVLGLLLEERGRPQPALLLLLLLGGRQRRRVGVGGARGVALALGERPRAVRVVAVVRVVACKRVDGECEPSRRWFGCLALLFMNFILNAPTCCQTPTPVMPYLQLPKPNQADNGTLK